MFMMLASKVQTLKHHGRCLYATALVLVLLIVLLNAVAIRIFATNYVRNIAVSLISSQRILHKSCALRFEHSV